MKRLYAFVLLSTGVCVARAQSSSIGMQPVDSLYSNYLYDTRVAYFKKLPVSKDEIVFVGNSITHWGDWAELLDNSKVRNRGIAGDISYGVLARIDEVTLRKPQKIFLMIGVNDIGRKIPISLTIKNYERILSNIKEQSPLSEVYIQSVLPINDDLINRKYYTGTNREISELNRRLEMLASKYSLPYLDLNKLFLDDKGQMHQRFTYDGIHLSSEGYLMWTDYLKANNYCCN